MNSPTRVFIAGREFAGNERQQQGLEVRTVDLQGPSNRVWEIQVTGTAEVCRLADRVSVRVSVGNSKESVNEVTNSVIRRVEYILQSLRYSPYLSVTEYKLTMFKYQVLQICIQQHGIKDEDTSVRRFLHREEDLYHMAAEVLVTFSDFEKMEQIRSILLEKLDKSVCVGTPQFYHSAGCLSELRKQVCVSAVQNAQQKASEVSQLLGQSLGPPLLVKEEETREWRNEDKEEGDRGNGAAHLCHLPCTPAINASSRVSVSFSLKDRSRKKV